MKSVLLRGLLARSEVVRPRLLFMLLAALSSPAYADGTWDDCVRSGGTSDYYQYFTASTVSLGRDAEVGDVVGPWIAASSIPAWTCTRRPAYGETANQVSVQGYPPYTRLGTVSADGETYGYYQAAGNAALGYIARWRAIIDGMYTDWTPLTVASSQQDAASTVTVVKAAGETYSIGVETQIRFVKRSTALVAGYTPVVFNPIYVRHHQQVGNTSFGGGATYRISQMSRGTATFEGGGTCTTPDVNVALPTVAASDFSGAASAAGATPFDLYFNNCPAGLNSIGYYFTPTTSIVDPTAGVIALDGTSTASGLGVQLTQADGAALQFGMANAYSLAYDPSVVGSYTVPLQAAYYQIGAAPVRGGTVRTAVIFTLDYK